jgi:hypothetical protein
MSSDEDEKRPTARAPCAVKVACTVLTGGWGNMTRDHMGQLCALSLPTAPIVKALLDAHKRGVRVEVILDKVRHEV